MSSQFPGDERLATDQLFPLLYDEMRRLAAQQLVGESPSCSLSPTSLVHEAYLRLCTNQDPKWQGRRHFFGAAAEAMRRILVDDARRRRAQKRGGDLKRVDLQLVEPEDTRLSHDVIALSEALDRLAASEPQAAELVKLRYFAGLSLQEAAELLQIPPRTADRLWAYARARLYRDIRPD